MKSPAGDAATPVGPSPTSIFAMRAPDGDTAITQFEPSMAMNATLESGSHATPRGSPADWRRSVSGMFDSV